MGESFTNVTEGSGKKLHSWQRTVNGNPVEDEFVLPGEYPLAAYVVPFASVSTATANDHLLQIMAGASNGVRIRRVWLRQGVLATTGTASTIQLLRLTTAGTGGGVITVAKLEVADAAAGATAMTLPTVKGTESTILYNWPVEFIQTRPNTMLSQIDWQQQPGMKPIIIAAGVANGVALKIITAVAVATVSGYVELVETNFV